MAPSLVSTLWFGALALNVLPAALAQERESCDEVVFNSEALNFDRQNNLIQLRGPRITQCDLRIVADEALATGVEFDQDGEWRLTGNVRVEAGTAVIQADRATFTFDNGQLSRGELEGGPVSFSDVDAAAQTSNTGRATKMSYDYVARTLRMIDGWVQKDKVEIQGCDLIYDFTNEGVTSGSADCATTMRYRRPADTNERVAAPDAPQ
jgi:lipopolysaccharide transport protein LptA